MTDDQRLSDPLAAAAALPRGSLVIVRNRDAKARIALGKAMLRLARSRGFSVLIAGDAELAARLGADGVHLAETHIRSAATWRARYPSMLITAAVHSLRAALSTGALPVDAVFLSPVFPTRSHPDADALTAIRANLIARAIDKPVYALGGIDARNARLLARDAFAGIVAIGALAV